MGLRQRSVIRSRVRRPSLSGHSACCAFLDCEGVWVRRMRGRKGGRDREKRGGVAGMMGGTGREERKKTNNK